MANAATGNIGKEQILKKAKALGISQGDVIAYLAAAADNTINLERQIKDLQQKMRNLNTRYSKKKTKTA